MVAVKATSNPVLVVCYGQSLWHWPIAGTTVQTLIRDAGYATLDLAEDGISWAQFSKKYEGTLLPQANSAPTVIGAFMGGTTDISEGATGSATYTHVKTMADAFKAAGANKCINMTLTGTFAGAQDTERDAYNAACITNSGGTFDAVVDLQANSNLDDPATDTAYYVDGAHWTTAGAAVAGGLIVAAIASVL